MISLPSFEERVAAIDREAGRLVTVISDVLDEPVPTCPGWTGRDLAGHVAAVFGFWAHQLTAGDPAERHEPPRYDGDADTGAEAVEWLDAAAAGLVESLNELGPDEPCWNWSGADLESAWVARRMALEIAVHRYDGELVAGDPTEIERALAVDGIDEKIGVHLESDVPDYRSVSLGGPICLCCSDAEAAWVVEVGNRKLRHRHGAGPAAAVVRGTASDVFLFTWNRVGLDRLELTGDRSVAEAWSLLPA